MEHPRKDCFKTFPLRFHFAISPKPFSSIAVNTTLIPVHNHNNNIQKTRVLFCFRPENCSPAAGKTTTDVNR